MASFGAPTLTPKLFGVRPSDPAKVATLLHLRTALTSSGLTPPPNGVFDFSNIPLDLNGWDNYYNDIEGDCVPAGLFHALEAVTNIYGDICRPASNCAQRAYEDITGYVPPGVGPGTDPIAALNYYRRTGIPSLMVAKPQITQTFNGSIANNILAAITVPANPLAGGQPIMGGNIPPSGVSINKSLGNGQYSLNVPAGVVLNVIAEQMTTKYTPQPDVIARKKIFVYMYVNPQTETNDFIVTAGYNLMTWFTLWMPSAWQNTAVWDAPTPAQKAQNPGAWNPVNGHWVYFCANVLPSNVFPTGGFKIATWNGTRLLTPAGFDYACRNIGSSLAGQLGGMAGQVFVALSKDMLNPITLTGPSGLDIPSIQAWLAANGSPVTS